MTDDEILRMERKANMVVAIQRTVAKSVLLVFFIIILLMFGKQFLPKEIRFMLINKYSLSVVLCLILISQYRSYKDLLHYLSVSSSIRYISKTSDNPLGDLKGFSILEKSQAYIAEKTLDYLKILSPLPFLLYVLGVFVGTQTSKTNVLYFLSYKLSLEDALMLLGVCSTVVFFIITVRVFDRFKRSTESCAEYERRVAQLEETKGSES